MAPRRGFASLANAIATDVRTELQLRPFDPLDPWRLAEALEIPVMRLSELQSAAPEPVSHFTENDPGAFSAMTLFSGRRRTIIHNDTHSPARQASNVTHELGHGLLLHPPTPPLDAGGLLDGDRALEEEATWLAGALLISEASAVLIVKQGWTLEEAAKRYGVSKQMVRFRINVTGARRRLR